MYKVIKEISTGKLLNSSQLSGNITLFSGFKYAHLVVVHLSYTLKIKYFRHFLNL